MVKIGVYSSPRTLLWQENINLLPNIYAIAPRPFRGNFKGLNRNKKVTIFIQSISYLITCPKISHSKSRKENSPAF